MKQALFSLLIAAVMLRSDSSPESFGGGPILYLPFDGRVKDESGNNHKVYQVGGKLSYDKKSRKDNAFEFDGVNDYIEIPDNEGHFSLNKFSIAFWFNSTSPDVQNLVGKENFITAESAVLQIFINWEEKPGLGFNIVNNNTHCSSASYLTSSYVNGGREIEAHTWHFVVATWNGKEQSIYFDGKLLQKRNPKFNAIKSCRSPIRLGIWYQGSLPFKGRMDEFMIFKKVLSEKQIKRMSNR